MTSGPHHGRYNNDGNFQGRGKVLKICDSRVFLYVTITLTLFYDSVTFLKASQIRRLALA